MPMVVNMHKLAMGNCKKIVKKEQTIIKIAGKERKLSYLISKKRKEEKNNQHQPKPYEKKKDKTAAQLQLVCQIQILLREKLLDPDPHSLRAHDYQSTTWDFHIILA